MRDRDQTIEKETEAKSLEKKLPFFPLKRNLHQRGSWSTSVWCDPWVRVWRVP